jgi:hypothetical protein
MEPMAKAVIEQCDRVLARNRLPADPRARGVAITKALNGTGVAFAAHGKDGPRRYPMQTLAKADRVCPGDPAGRLPAHLRKGHAQDPEVIDRPTFEEMPDRDPEHVDPTDLEGVYGPIEAARRTVAFRGRDGTLVFLSGKPMVAGNPYPASARAGMRGEPGNTGVATNIGSGGKIAKRDYRSNAAMQAVEDEIVKLSMRIAGLRKAGKHHEADDLRDDLGVLLGKLRISRFAE